MNGGRIITTTILGAMSLVSSLALAGNPHFIKNATSADLDGANLVVSFKEAGLESGSHETVTVACDAAVTYECVNGGGKNPSASNKHVFDTKLSTSGVFDADKNGNIEGSLTLEPASASDLGFSCPNGQTTTFVSVQYSSCSLTDSTSGASMSFRGSFSYSNPDAPPVR
jgi:hypothetical protein